MDAITQFTSEKPVLGEEFMETGFQLTIHSEGATEEESVYLGRDLLSDLNEYVPDCSAAKVAGASPGINKKGVDVAIITAISLALINKGVIKELVNCLKAFINKKGPKVSFSMEGKDGAKVTLNAENLGKKDIESLFSQLGLSVPASKP